MKKTIAELLELTRQKQNAYLAILQDEEPKRLKHQIFKAETDRLVKARKDNLNSSAKSSKVITRVVEDTEGRMT